MDKIEESRSGNHTYRTVAEVLDKEWLDEGMSEQDLGQNTRLAEIFDRLLAAGRTVDDINAEWERKSPQEILCEYDTLLSANENNLVGRK